MAFTPGALCLILSYDCDLRELNDFSGGMGNMHCCSPLPLCAYTYHVLNVLNSSRVTLLSDVASYGE